MEKNFNNVQEALTLDNPETHETIEVTIDNIKPLIGKHVRIIGFPEVLPAGWDPQQFDGFIGKIVKIKNRVFFVEMGRFHVLLPYKTKVSINKI